MPHSAAFNERRRAAYREGRLLGLAPRDAGHLYSPADVERAAKGDVKAKRTTRQGTFQERQAAYAAKLSDKLGRRVTVRESMERYRVHNLASVHTRARLTIQGSDGVKRRKTVTLLSSGPLTRAEARARIDGFLLNGGIEYGEGALIAVDFTEADLYPDVNY